MCRKYVHLNALELSYSNLKSALNVARNLSFFFSYVWLTFFQKIKFLHVLNIFPELLKLCYFLWLFPRWIWISQYMPFYVFIDSIKLAKWMRDKCFIFISISQCLCHFMPHDVNIYIRSSLWLGKHHDIFSALCKFCWSINGFIISINIRLPIQICSNFAEFSTLLNYWNWLDFFPFNIEWE